MSEYLIKNCKLKAKKVKKIKKIIKNKRITKKNYDNSELSLLSVSSKNTDVWNIKELSNYNCKYSDNFSNGESLYFKIEFDAMLNININ